MSPQSGIDLFTTFADRVMLRVDEVLSNRECKWPPSEDQRRLLGMLKSNRGRENARPLGEICDRLRLTPRIVKDLVQDLRVNFFVQICASRDGSAGGYYLANNQQEVAESTRQMWNQAITMLRVCRAMRGPNHDLAEMLGQLRIELEMETANAAEGK
jgi:hypothetical protein